MRAAAQRGAVQLFTPATLLISSAQIRAICVRWWCQRVETADNADGRRSYAQRKLKRRGCPLRDRAAIRSRSKCKTLYHSPLSETSVLRMPAT